MNRELKKLIRYNRSALLSSDKSLKSIFEIMFHWRNNVMCETNDGIRIQKYTYGEMYDGIIRVASALFERIGPTHGYVALEMDNSPQWITAFWAILLSGNKPYLVNMRYPASLTEGILKTLNVKYTICSANTGLSTEAITFSSLWQKSDCPAVSLDHFENEIAFSSSATSMNEVICIYSGEQIAQQILNFKSIIKENPRMAKHYKGHLKQLAFLPFYHVFGLFAVFFWFCFFSRTLVFLKDYSADTILKTCRRHQVTHIFAVPMLWHTVESKVLSTVARQSEQQRKKFHTGMRLSSALQNLFPSFAPEISKRIMHEITDKLFGKSVIFCINGGSYLRPSAMEFFNGIGYSMHNGYGMSEIGITSVDLRCKPIHLNLNSIGKPFDSVEYRLNSDGCLEVKGSSLCTCKIINGKSQTFADWFNTGDRMELRDGYYYILGRESDIVIGDNGENINPDTVEALFAPAGVSALSVLGLGGKSEEKLSIVLQISHYLSQQKLDRIKEQVYSVNSTLPIASAIKEFYFTYDELSPPTAVKVSRKQLLSKIEKGEVHLIPFSELSVASSSQDADSPIMAEVKRIIAQELDIAVESITAQSHLFFDLGASSIQYFSVISALAQSFSISEYDSSEKFCYTPQEICEYIERYL